MKSNEAHKWLTEQFSEFTTEKDVLTGLWSHAVSKRDKSKPIEGWRKWVLWCCKEARGEGVKAPVALLRQKLQTTDQDNGPPRGRPEKPVRAISNQSDSERAEHKARAAAARAGRPEPIPPFAVTLGLAKRIPIADAIREVTAEWVRQGKPYPDEFDASPLERVR